MAPIVGLEDEAVLEAVAELGERRAWITIRMERAVGVCRALGEELVERVLEADDVPELLLGRGRREVDGTVEHHRSDAGGEQLRVHRADGGPVGVAEVGELRIAEGGTDVLQVMGDGPGADLGEPRALLVDARLDEVDRGVRSRRSTSAAAPTSSAWDPPTRASRTLRRRRSRSDATRRFPWDRSSRCRSDRGSASETSLRLGATSAFQDHPGRRSSRPATRSGAAGRSRVDGRAPAAPARPSAGCR